MTLSDVNENAAVENQDIDLLFNQKNVHVWNLSCQ